MNSGTKPYSAQVGGTKAEVHGKAATIYGIALLNETAAVAYLQLFKRASADVTVGTTAPDLSLGLPANGGLTLSFPRGFILGGEGLTVAGTTTRAGSTGANISVNIIYG